MNVPLRSSYVVILFLIVTTLMLSGVVLAGPPRFRVYGHPLAWGGSCEPGLNVIAGSRFFITVKNAGDQTKQSPVLGWPEGYFLEAAIDPPKDRPFVATPGLIERMQPTRYLSQLNRGASADLNNNPESFWNYEDLNAKDFVLSIPGDLAGHMLGFRARFEGEGLSLVSETFGPFKVVAPCDRSDTARILAQRIYEAWNVGDYPLAIELADSMLTSGLSDAAGWWWAGQMARGLRQYDKALLYLERIYEDFGVLAVELNTANPPRSDRGGPRNPEIQELYQRGRNYLLQRIAENEQQQR